LSTKGGTDAQTGHAQAVKRAVRKVFLIYGPTGLYMRDDRCQAPVEGMTAQPNRAPLDLAYMAAMLEREGAACRIRDYAAEGLSWKDFEKDLLLFGPDLLVVSVTTPTFERDLEACRIAKGLIPDITTVAKGAHFSPKDEEVFLSHREMDLAIRGESEHAIVEIASGRSYRDILGLTYRQGDGLKRNARRPYIETEDLDRLPFPARHLIRNELYTAPDTGEPITLINVGRGCPHRCIFCAVSIASGFKLKVRSPANVADELEECVKRHGIRNFFFRADTFTWNEDWTVEVCREILRRDLKIRWGTNSRVDTISPRRLEWMKKAGCWIIGFGIESGNDESLKLMKKRATCADARRAVYLTKRHGIKTYGLFIVGLPWETRAMVEDTARFMRELDPDFADVNIAYPLPGTEYYRMALEQGLFREEDFGKGDYSKAVVRTSSLSSGDLVRLRRKAILAFYLRPSYIWRTLAGIRSFGVFRNYIYHGLKLLGAHLTGSRQKDAPSQTAAAVTSRQNKHEELEHAQKILDKTEFYWNSGTEAGRRGSMRRAKWIAGAAGLKPGKRVLETGCGTGFFSGIFAESGCELHCVDLVPDFIRRAESRGIANARFRVADVEALPYEDGFFDALVGVRILHHLDMEAAFREFSRVLKDGGVIAFCEPNMMNPQLLIQKNVPWVKKKMGDTPSETAFFRWALRRFLIRRGFEDVMIRPFDFLHPWIPASIAPAAERLGLKAEKVPVLREIAGSLKIYARKTGRV